MTTDYNTIRQDLLGQFRTQWTTRQPAWSQSTRVGWPLGDEPDHGRQQWLRIAISDNDGFDSAVAVADVSIGLFSVDLFTPLPELDTSQQEIVATDLRNTLRALTVGAFRPVRLWKRDFGRNEKDFAHTRINLAFEYDLEDPS